MAKQTAAGLRAKAKMLTEGDKVKTTEIPKCQKAINDIRAKLAEARAYASVTKDKGDRAKVCNLSADLIEARADLKAARAKLKSKSS